MTGGSVVRGRELPRKTLHLTTAVIPLALWQHAPQRLIAAGLVMLFGLACVVELARRRSSRFASQFESAVGVMLRPHEAGTGITGATWLLAAFALTCLAAPLPAAIAATWAGAVGDASAALVGRWWGRRSGATGKTIAGSLACVMATAVGAWWLAGFGPALAAGLGLLAAAAERPAIALDDNVRVTASVAIGAAILALR